MMRLTFDWDSVGLEDKLVQEGLAKLSKDFPKYDVYYRLSASKTGIHALISPKNMKNPAPVEIDDEDALNYRQEMVDFGLEDVWRLKGDKARLKSGGITAQLFQYKNENTAGEWVKYVE